MNGDYEREADVRAKSLLGSMAVAGIALVGCSDGKHSSTVGPAGGAAGSSAGGSAGDFAGSGSPGPVITFNDDGGWCWYQDERAIVDTTSNQLILGSVATGSSRSGQIDVTMYDLAGGTDPQRTTLGTLNPDDHNTPALLKVRDGRYVAMYAGHNQDCNSYYHVYDGGAWGPQNAFDWTSAGCPAKNGNTVTYANLWPISGRIYSFVRSIDSSPNILGSDDGSQFDLVGRLTATPKVGYVAGYYKYWGNGTDRVDFLGTEAHPRNNDNSLYHGYVQGQVAYDSNGNQVDDNVFDSSAQDVVKYTKAFATGTSIAATGGGSVTLTHMWNFDLMRYDDGTIVALGQGRADTNTDDPDKRFIYARFDGSTWQATYLVKAGPKLYASEEDYTGLGAIHPNDPHTIYVSTVYDPTDDQTTSDKHEIWRGTTNDNGATFQWTPITQNSTQDNLRPIVPFWDSPKTALLWERGDYVSAQAYSTSIVGVIMDGR
jgi:hypothetical protein